MRNGWVVRAEDSQSQEVVYSVLALSKTKAKKRCEELRKINEAIKIELVGPYTEVEAKTRKVKVVASQDLLTVFKEHADLSPLLLGRDEQGLKIEVDDR
jgi:hypothetical protein